MAVPMIRARNGRLYYYDQSQEEYVSLDSLPQYQNDVACQQKYVHRIEQMAGIVASCREVQPPGEWCPAPYTVFASTPNGDLWVFREEQPCWFSTITLTMIFVPIGLVMGLVIVFVKKTRAQFVQ